MANKRMNSMRERAAMAEARYGGYIGASKGSPPPKPIKVIPKMTNNKIGVTIKMKF